jgi:putative tricarboxylic transport membrane protein
MQTPAIRRRTLLATAAAGGALLAAGRPLMAAETIDRVNFLVGFGAGGGFDQTARGTMEALQKSGLVPNVTVENRTGAGGSVAIAHLVETAARQQSTLMVNGSSIIIRSLNREFSQTFRDVTVVNTITAEVYGILVAGNGPYRDIDALSAALKANPRAARFGGGSPRGGIDHLAASLYLKELGTDAKQMNYIAYDGGGRALAGVMGNEVQVLVMPFTEALSQIRSGQIRLLALMSDQRLKDVPDAPTFVEKGLPKVVMYNVRGFFMAPGTPQARVDAFADLMERLIATPAWEEVRSRFAWNMFYRRGPAAQQFYVEHEQALRTMLVELGMA